MRTLILILLAMLLAACGSQPTPPVPTVTPRPTETPSATGTPVATATPTATATGTPTATPVLVGAIILWCWVDADESGTVDVGEDLVDAELLFIGKTEPPPPFYRYWSIRTGTRGVAVNGKVWPGDYMLSWLSVPMGNWLVPDYRNPQGTTVEADRVSFVMMRFSWWRPTPTATPTATRIP